MTFSKKGIYSSNVPRKFSKQVNQNFKVQNAFFERVIFVASDELFSEEDFQVTKHKPKTVQELRIMLREHFEKG